MFNKALIKMNHPLLNVSFHNPNKGFCSTNWSLEN